MTNDSFNTSYATAFFGMACPEELSAERVLRQLYPDGPKCASCGAQITGNRSVASFWRGDRTYCASCDSKFSPSSGTILANSHISYSQFETMIVCFALGADYKQIAALIHIHPDTVTNWHNKIRFWESHV